MSDLTVPNLEDPTKRDRVWSDTTFQRFIAIAGSAAGAVTDSNKIGLSDVTKKIEAWPIAGVRFDAGAPGLSDAIIEEYGQSPQIRLIVQPVIREADGTVTVVDTTAHLVDDRKGNSSNGASRQTDKGFLLSLSVGQGSRLRCQSPETARGTSPAFGTVRQPPISERLDASRHFSQHSSVTAATPQAKRGRPANPRSRNLQ
jgi:hypothetical protein